MLRSIVAARTVVPCAAARFIGTSPQRLNGSTSSISDRLRISITPTDSGPLPYFVHRSKTKNLPVYQEVKPLGPKMQTRIRKLEGNLDTLRDHLAGALSKRGVTKDDILINHLNKNILVKGHHRNEIMALLEQMGF